VVSKNTGVRIMDFYAHLLVALRESDFRKVDIAKFLVDVIRNVYIPRIEDMAEKERNPEKKEKLLKLIEEWTLYSDPNVPGSKVKEWNIVANNALIQLSRAYGLSDTAVMDVAQNISGDFYLHPQRWVEKFNPLGGPRQFFSYWKTVMYNEVREALDKRHRKTKIIVPVDEKTNSIEKEEFVHVAPNMESPMMKTRSPGSDSPGMEDVLRNGRSRMLLWDYASQILSDDELAMAAFEAWFEVTKRVDAAGINFTKDVIPLFKKMTKRPPSAFYFIWNRKVKKVILKFLVDEYDIHFSESQKRKFKLAELLAEKEYRKRMALWVLSMCEEGRAVLSSLVFGGRLNADL